MRRLWAVLILSTAFFSLGPDSSEARSAPQDGAQDGTQTPSAETGTDLCSAFGWRESAQQLGLNFRHDAAFSEEKLLPETMGAGLAWLDYDGDGLLDLWLVQSRGRDRLFRQTLQGAFIDVSDRALSRISPLSSASSADPPAKESLADAYGQGILAVDLNDDGAVDVVRTSFGRDTLHFNRGDGSFGEPIALDPRASNGQAVDWKEAWSVSAAAADADGDGDLDLYVTGYLEFDPAQDLFCGDFESGERTYCDPSIFSGAEDRFYLQDDGAFRRARAAGVEAARGKGLGVVFTDLDDDGRADLYVANDLTANLLFQGRGDGTFVDLSLLSGAGANAEGQFEAGMGIALGDVDRDGHWDLAVTNFDVETNTLYRHLGGLFYEDVSASSGFGVPSFNLLGFGIALADFDRDGALDAWVANGHIFPQPKRKNVTWRQPDLLLRGDGRGRFQSVECPQILARPEVGRGLAVADFEGDGDLDVAISNNDGPAQLWLSDPAQGAWLAVRIAADRLAVGADLTLTDSMERLHRRRILAGDSYASGSERAAFFGLGDASPGPLVVRTPDGTKRMLRGLPANHRIQLRFTSQQP